MGKELNTNKMESLMKIIDDVSNKANVGKASRFEVVFKSDHPVSSEVNKILEESTDPELRDMRVHLFESLSADHNLNCRRVWDPIREIYVIICQ